MGYYTYYTLEAKDAKTRTFIDEALEREICERLYEISNGAFYYGDTFYECFGSEHKWYNHQEDMIKLSKEYPDIVFILDGEGEDREDIWRLYVQNGEWEEVRAMIVWNTPGYEKFKGFGA